MHNTRSAARSGWPAVLLDWSWLAPWAALLVTPLILRGPLPPDELRYLSVAWEMWSNGDFLVPRLNGLPYSDKAPLLFWLMHLGWLVSGVNDVWPRILPSVFAFCAAVSTRALCRALWPERLAAQRAIPWILLGMLAWVVYTQAVLFDLLLVNWTLLGMHGILRAARGDRRGWSFVAAAVALGLLTKGPAMLVHIAGPGLLVRWWATDVRPRRWYPPLLLAVLVGVLGALLWAVPAAIHGSGAYAAEILLGQTTDRLVDSFAHARPIWYFVWVLPLMLLPWSALPAAWAAIFHALREPKLAGGARMLLAAIVPTFIVFSAISGKQPHYLLPLLPLFAILLAAVLADEKAPSPRLAGHIPVLAAASLAIAWAYLPLSPIASDLTVEHWSPLWGIGAAVLMLPLARPGHLLAVARRLGLATPILVIAIEAAFFQVNAPSFDLASAAVQVRKLQDSGNAIAYVGSYNGELNFLGRLTAPIEVIEAKTAEDWAARHGDGYLIGRLDAAPEGAAYTQPLRGKWLAIGAASNPSIRKAFSGSTEI